MVDRKFSWILVAFACLAGVVLVFVTASVNFEVCMRYFLNRPTTWVSDYSEFAIVYITFLAGAWVLAEEAHVKVEILTDRLSIKTQSIITTITSIIAAVLCGLFFWYGLQITLEAFELQTMYVGGTNTIKWPILMVLPLGSLLLVLQFLRRAWHHSHGIRGPEEVLKGI